MSGESDELYDDPIDALAELFAVVNPEPDQHFAARLESDLRISHAEHSVARRPSRVGSRVTTLAALSVVILVAATVSLVWRDPSVSSALEMSNADGVIVTLPDGSTIDDPADGFDLPEGTVIVVRIGGSVTIDDVSLRDGVVVTVRDGSLVTDAQITTTTARPDDQVPKDGRRPVRTAPLESVVPVPDVPVPVPPISERPVPMEPPPPAVPDPPIVAVPGPVQDPVRSVDPTGPRPVGPNPSVGIPPAPPDGPPPSGTSTSLGVEIALGVKIDGKSGRVVVTWSIGRALDPMWRALVVRSTGEIQPDWPLGPASVQLGESHGVGRSELIDEPGPDVDAVNYRVVVVDGSGGVVARGAVQSVSLR